MNKMNVQYGCGLSAPDNWINYDASPTLRLQRLPLIGKIISSNLNVFFPPNVRYGDIVKGLPGIMHSSCDNVYCSHVLEHLSLSDFRLAIANTYMMLKKGGVFRCVLPDLEVLAREYIKNVDNNDTKASIKFLDHSHLGVKIRDKGIKSILSSLFGNSHHLWMWDHLSLKEELISVGFNSVRICKYHDSERRAFIEVENISRFNHSVAIECIK